MFFSRQNPRSRAPLRASVLLMLLLIAVVGQAGAAPSVRDDLWVTNGPVYSSVTYGNDTGYSSGSAAALNTVSGLLDTSFPKVTGTVYVVIANGTDSWYIGGDFTSVGGIARNNLARINANKTVDVNWDPDADGPVHTMLLVGTTLVVGGEFTHIGGAARNHVAALITTLNSNFVTAWNPDTDDTVLTMALFDTTLYIGGEFTQVNVGSSTPLDRNYIAAVDANIDEDGNTIINDWDPDADGFVRSIVTSGDGLQVYAGGDFTSIGGQSRIAIAALDSGTDTNNATVWKPDANSGGSVHTMLLSGNTLYVGGDFVSIGGKNRNRIAALNTLIDINNATEWDPNADDAVHTMNLDSNILYVGGDFTSIGGKARDHIASLVTNANTNNVTSWKPGLDGPVYGMVRAATTLYVGGAFDTVTDDSRLYIGGDFTYVGPGNGSGVGITTAVPGQASDVFPVVNGPVYTAIFDGTNGWYIGGDFDDVGGVTRNNIAHVKLSGADYIVEAGWAPDSDGPVNALALSSDNSTLYVGGSFTSIGGQNRSNIASIATADGSADLGWDPNASGAVNALALSSDDSTLYVGGSFTSIGGENRNYIASLAQADGSADPTWNPNASGTVNALALSSDDSTLYVGGDFTSIGGIVRKHVAAMSATGSGVLMNWLVNAGDSVQTLSLDGPMIYVGGTFTSIGGVVRNRIAALDLINGSATTWDPGANNVVRSLVMSADQSKLYVGGDFTVIGGSGRNRVAAINRISGLATSWHPDANGAVYAMILDGDGINLYVGGEFTSFDNNAIVRNHIASLATNATDNSAIVNAWDPNATDGAVRAMALFGATLYVGGDFTVSGTIGGVNRNHIAALKTTDNTASAWNPDANNNVLAMSLSVNGLLLYVGGEFTNFDGGTVLRNHLAVLDTSTVVIADMLTDWDPDVDDTVRALSLSQDGSTIYIGGDFATLGTGPQTRNGIAALQIDDGSPISWWDTGADAPVYSITISDDGGMIYTGGTFTRINTSVHSYYAALDVLAPVTRPFPPAGAYSAGLDVKLICDDGFGTACVTTYYTTDGSSPTTSSATYSAPITINADVTIKFFSVDNAGNQEEVQTASYMIETIPPVTTADPTGGVLGSGGNSITLTCTDTGGGTCAATYYTLDGSTPTTSSTVYVDPIILQDDTTLKFFSVDSAGNTESSVNTETYIVDISVPRTTASPATRVFDAGKLTITLSCDDTPLPEVVPGIGDIPEGAVDPNTGDFPNPDDFNNPTPSDFTTTSVVFITSVVNTGTGCVATYYTTDGTTPTTASTPYTGPFNIRDNTILKFFSVDSAGNKEGVKLESYISHKSNIGMFGPFTFLLCFIGIGIRCRLRHPSCH